MDGNQSTAWDAQVDAKTGKFWFEFTSTAGGAGSAGMQVDMVRLFTPLGGVRQGFTYFWKPRDVVVMCDPVQVDQDVRVEIMYEMYDGLPVMAKRVSLSSSASTTSSTTSTASTSSSSPAPAAVCHNVSSLVVEELAMQETKAGRSNFFDPDQALFMGERISLHSSYSRGGPQFGGNPCTDNGRGGAGQCMGGAGLFGLSHDDKYTNSYQFQWLTILSAGYSARPDPATGYLWTQSFGAAGACDNTANTQPHTHAHVHAHAHAPHTTDAADNTDATHAPQPRIFHSFTLFELLHDRGPGGLDGGGGLERRGLAVRKLYRALAPQVTENPMYVFIQSAYALANTCTKSTMGVVRVVFRSNLASNCLSFQYISHPPPPPHPPHHPDSPNTPRHRRISYMHCTDSSPAGLTQCVDSAAAVGFEMVIISFGAGFDLESTNVTYIASMAAIVAYGKKKGVELGGYDEYDCAYDYDSDSGYDYDLTSLSLVYCV